MYVPCQCKVLQGQRNQRPRGMMMSSGLDGGDRSLPEVTIEGKTDNSMVNGDVL
jgi:hypothetical protein